MFKFLWMDTETTGLDPVENDIIQLSGMIKVPGEETATFDYRVKPFNPENIQQEALDVNGITREEMMNYAAPEDVHQEFVTLLDRYVNRYNKFDKFVLAGQNVQFDCDFVHNFFKKNGDVYWFSWVGYSHFDLKNLAILYEMYNKKRCFPDYTLSSVCNILGVQFDGKAHDSLADIQATRRACKLIWETLIKGEKR